MPSIKAIQPCLWFDDQAEAAVAFYTGVFENSKIKQTARYGEAGKEVHGRPAGSVMTIEFELNGQPFTALNGGPHFKLNEAVSFQIFCATQAEMDYFWDKLTVGGDPKAQQCGWLKDRFGLSWQVVPTAMGQLMRGPNAGRVMTALMKMKKLDLAALEAAAW